MHFSWRFADYCLSLQRNYLEPEKPALTTKGHERQVELQLRQVELHVPEVELQQRQVELQERHLYICGRKELTETE